MDPKQTEGDGRPPQQDPSAGNSRNAASAGPPSASLNTRPITVITQPAAQNPGYTFVPIRPGEASRSPTPDVPDAAFMPQLPPVIARRTAGGEEMSFRLQPVFSHRNFGQNTQNQTEVSRPSDPEDMPNAKRRLSILKDKGGFGDESDSKPAAASDRPSQPATAQHVADRQTPFGEVQTPPFTPEPSPVARGLDKRSQRDNSRSGGGL